MGVLFYSLSSRCHIVAIKQDKAHSQTTHAITRTLYYINSQENARQVDYIRSAIDRSPVFEASHQLLTDSFRSYISAENKNKINAKSMCIDVHNRTQGDHSTLNLFNKPVARRNFPSFSNNVLAHYTHFPPHFH